MPRQWFNCWECGRTKANEYSECAYCGGDVEIIDGGEMIDIDAMDRDALIAEIRRLRGTREHRKCPCGGLGGIKKMHGKYWAECNNCECSTDTLDTPEEAWAAWDGVA